MRIALTLTAAPKSSESFVAALRFAHAALMAGHEIAGVFLLQDAVTLADARSRTELSQRWLELGRAAGIDIGVCSGAAARREVRLTAAPASVVEHTPRRSGIDRVDDVGPGGPAASFCALGMGQIVMALAAADRVVEFRG